MTKNPPRFSCPCAATENTTCAAGGKTLPAGATPLSLACGPERFKVCRVSGDRKTCARMAQLGVLPGSEIEVVCPGSFQKCMFRIKGSTVTLDPLFAEQILVTPL